MKGKIATHCLGLVVGGMMLSATSASAQQKLVDYGKAQLASESVSNSGYSSGTALVLSAGKHLQQKGLAVEGELTKTIGEPDISETLYGTTISGKIDVLSLGGYAVYDIPMQANNISVRVRGGLVYRSADETVSCSGTFAGACTGYTGSNTDTKIGLGFGAGVAYSVSPKLSLIGEYTSIPDVSHLSFGVRYKF